MIAVDYMLDHLAITLMVTAAVFLTCVTGFQWLVFILVMLSSHVKCCWNKTATWGFGVTEWDMVVHRYVHIGRLCIDFEQHPDMTMITINIRVPRSWLRKFFRS